MSNNPLQSTGPIKFSDVMKEKEWAGTEAKTMTDMVENYDQSGDLILNLNNPAEMIARIQAKPYTVSDWYGYNHALGSSGTVGDVTITWERVIPVEMTKHELNSSFLHHHRDNIKQCLANVQSGNATSISVSVPSTDYEYTLSVQENSYEDVTDIPGQEYSYTSLYLWLGIVTFHISRQYMGIDLSQVPIGSVINKISVKFDGAFSSDPAINSPRSAILVSYPYETFTTSYWELGDVISYEETLGNSEIEFELNAKGVELANLASQSNDRIFRIGIVFVDEDYLARDYMFNGLYPGYMGHNLIPSGSSDMTDSIWYASENPFWPRDPTFSVTDNINDSSADLRRTSVVKMEFTEQDTELYDNNGYNGPFFNQGDLLEPMVNDQWYMFYLQFRYGQMSNSDIIGKIKIGNNYIIKDRTLPLIIGSDELGWPRAWYELDGYTTGYLAGTGGYSANICVSAFDRRGTRNIEDAEIGDSFFMDSVFFGKTDFTKEYAFTFTNPRIQVFYTT